MTPDTQAESPRLQTEEGEGEEVTRNLEDHDRGPDFHEWFLEGNFPHQETDDTLPEVWETVENPTACVTLEQEGLSGQAPSDPPRTPSKVKQREFWLLAGLDRDAIVTKLRQANEHGIADKIHKCHTEQTVQRCDGCSKIVTFWNRCDLVVCPICQPRLAYERKKAVQWWTKQVHQPKHVVLTCRNTATITRETVDNFKRAIRRLRRRKIARGWRGGFGCLEITNEGRGWHLHAHLLVDANWIDAKALALTFGDLVGQEFAIVHVADARGEQFLHQVSKYVVKGNQLQRWTPNDVAAFVLALQGTRTFFTFGDLYKREAAFRAVLNGLSDARRKCQCGCNKFSYFTPDEWEWHQIANQPRGPAASPKDEQQALALP
mgnify:CR=1 FL=1